MWDSTSQRSSHSTLIRSLRPSLSRSYSQSQSSRRPSSSYLWHIIPIRFTSTSTSWISLRLRRSKCRIKKRFSESLNPISFHWEESRYLRMTVSWLPILSTQLRSGRLISWRSKSSYLSIVRITSILLTWQLLWSYLATNMLCWAPKKAVSFFMIFRLASLSKKLLSRLTQRKYGNLPCILTLRSEMQGVTSSLPVLHQIKPSNSGL